MNTDYARTQSDELLQQIERRLREEYQKAQADITKKWDAYMKAGEARLDALYNAYINAPDGKKLEAKQKYQDALRNYTLGNERFYRLERETAKRISNANQIAIDYINGRLPEIYSVNLNYQDPEFAKLGIAFDLVDEDTVKRLISDGDIKLPRKKLNKKKDIDWNTKQMSSSILQGIIQGESMDKIAKRLLPIIGFNVNSAIRNARTLVTGAENRGRQDRYKRLENQGVIMYKMWIATGDDRTREWHLDMDGQEVPADDMFIDGLGNELEYPGDPDAPNETVWNCRCSMRGVPRGIRGKNGKITWFKVPKHNGLHQQQIKEEKRARGM